MKPYLLHNAQAAPLSEIPVVSAAEFRKEIIAAAGQGARIAALYGIPNEPVRIVAVLANDRVGSLSMMAADIDDSYPALTPDCPQAHWFEREIGEQCGIRPEGHPWLKPIRFHAAYRGDIPGAKCKEDICPGVTEFYAIGGKEIHDVAVGPVHAGIIEPGHFRFQCHGENVFHLEISLGYQHRGIERKLLSGPHRITLFQMETIAGDTSIGHATAYCQAIEALAQCKVPARAQAIRAIALELERIANHVGDLGALSGDIGYLPTASYCGRIRGDFLNMTALLCGNRFGRGLVCPGGVTFDLDATRADELLTRLDAGDRDLHSAINLLWDSPSVRDRFEHTGTITQELCYEIGLVGPVARACGVTRDVRNDHPFGIFRFSHLPTSTWHTGDVFARAHVRWLEVQRSINFIREQIQSMPTGNTRYEPGDLAPNSTAVSMIEGWRGEICHLAQTDADGRFLHYKIVDPSFHNWFGLAYALRNQQISDFPLCNKSFNLSYCGHDL